MKLIPLQDRVVLKVMEAEETTRGGIILAPAAKEKPSVAEVISVGPGGMVDGKEIAMTVKAGDYPSSSPIPQTHHHRNSSDPTTN